MLIDNPVSLIGLCAVGGVFLNLAMLKLSPQISDKTRHLVSGLGPVVIALAAYIGTSESVVADGGDLATLGGALASGVFGAIGATWFVRPQTKLTKS